MTRQQEAEKRLFIELRNALWEGGPEYAGSSIADVVSAIRQAIAADPSLLDAFGERRSQTITQAAHGSSQLTALERAQIAAKFDDECGSVTGLMRGD